MAESKAVVLARISQAVKLEMEIPEERIKRLVRKSGMTVQQAEDHIVSASVARAYEMSYNNEALARTALIVVRGKASRLVRCVELLEEHGHHIVKSAYEMHEELDSNISLGNLCKILKHLDTDFESGEASQLRWMLAEIASHSMSINMEVAKHYEILAGLEAGHMLETVFEMIMNEIEAEYDSEST